MEKIFPKRLVTTLLALLAIVTMTGQAHAQTHVTGKVTAAADGTYSMMLPKGTTELSVVWITICT